MKTGIFCLLFVFITKVSSDLNFTQFENCAQFVNKSKLLDLDPGSRVKLCSLLTSNESDDQHNPDSSRSRPSPYEVWGYSLLMVTFISLTSVVGVGVMPLMSRTFYSNLLTCLIGLAVGSLAGSAVFHLIPSAFRLAEIDIYTHHSYLSISMSIWMGLYLFFIIERFLKIFMDAKARKQGEVLHGHGHSHHGDYQQKSALMTDDASTITSGDGDTIDNVKIVGNGDHNHHDDYNEDVRRTCNGMLEDTSELYSTSQSAIRASFGHQDRPHPASRPTVEGVRSLSTRSGGNKIATVAWMIIFGDGIHNFIDGLSIGELWTFESMKCQL